MENEKGFLHARALNYTNISFKSLIGAEPWLVVRTGVIDKGEKGGHSS